MSGGFLGYDPWRLDGLRRLLGEIADEAGRLRLADPLAVDATAPYRRAVALVLNWRPPLDAIGSCAFDAAYRPIALDAGALDRVDVAHPLDPGWAVVTDPRRGAVDDLAEHASHLAELVATATTRALHGDGGNALATHLSLVLATADGRDAFLATLGPEGLGRAAALLAAPIAAGDGDAAVAQALLTALARAVGAGVRAGTVDAARWEEQLAERTDPFAAALVLRDADLPTAAVTTMVPRLWDRWAAEPHDGIDEGAAPAATTPDALVAALVRDPAAARQLLAGWPADRLDELLGTLVTPGAVADLLLASTDHGTAPADDVRPSMTAVLAFLDEHKDLAEANGVRPVLGAYIGPYLEGVVGATDGSAYPSPPWDWGGRDMVAVVGWIAGVGQAARDVAAWADAIVSARVVQLAATPGFTDPALAHLGQIAGALDRALSDRAVSEANARRQAWIAVWDVIAARGANALASSAGLPAGSVTAYGVSAVVGAAIGSFAEQWARHDWPGGPGDLAGLVETERAVIADRNGDREATVVRVAFEAGLAAGTMGEADRPPPPGTGDYLPALTTWAQQDPTPARRRLWALAAAISLGTCRETEACDGAAHATGAPTVG